MGEGKKEDGRKSDYAALSDQLRQSECRVCNSLAKYGEHAISSSKILGSCILVSALLIPFFTYFLDIFSTQAIKTSLDRSNNDMTKLTSDQATEIKNLTAQISDLKGAQEYSNSERYKLAERVKTLEQSTLQQETQPSQNLSSGADSAPQSTQRIHEAQKHTPKAKTPKKR